MKRHTGREARGATDPIYHHQQPRGPHNPKFLCFAVPNPRHREHTPTTACDPFVSKAKPQPCIALSFLATKRRPAEGKEREAHKDAAARVAPFLWPCLLSLPPAAAAAPTWDGPRPVVAGRGRVARNAAGLVWVAPCVCLGWSLSANAVCAAEGRSRHRYRRVYVYVRGRASPLIGWPLFVNNTIDRLIPSVPFRHPQPAPQVRGAAKPAAAPVGRSCVPRPSKAPLHRSHPSPDTQQTARGAARKRGSRTTLAQQCRASRPWYVPRPNPVVPMPSPTIIQHTHVHIHIHHQMPNMAGRTGADPDAARLADYRARAGVRSWFWLLLMMVGLWGCWGQSGSLRPATRCVCLCWCCWSSTIRPCCCAVLSRTLPSYPTHLTPPPKPRRTQANRSAVTPILQGIQGRRTGLIMAKRVSKDSDGFEDIDAFWDMASGKR